LAFVFGLAILEEVFFVGCIVEGIAFSSLEGVGFLYGLIKNGLACRRGWPYGFQVFECRWLILVSPRGLESKVVNHLPSLMEIL